MSYWNQISTDILKLGELGMIIGALIWNFSENGILRHKVLNKVTLIRLSLIKDSIKGALKTF